MHIQQQLKIASKQICAIVKLHYYAVHTTISNFIMLVTKQTSSKKKIMWHASFLNTRYRKSLMCINLQDVMFICSNLLRLWPNRLVSTSVSVSGCWIGTASRTSTLGGEGKLLWGQMSYHCQ